MDTCIVFHVLKQTALGRHVVDALRFRTRNATPMISVVTQGELFALAARNNYGKPKLDRLEELLNGLVIVDINARPIIDRYAAIDSLSHGLGRKMGKNDLWIVASAIETDCLLLTADLDFSHLHPAHARVWYFDPAAGSWPSVPP